MTTVHLSGIVGVTWHRAFGFVGSAEGFVFLSGLVIGARYASKLTVDGFDSVRRKLFARAAVLYVTQIVLVGSLVGVTLLAPAVASYWQLFIPVSASASPLSLISTALLLHQPPLIDILPMFVGFALMAPFVLRALGGGYHRLVIALSIALWAMAYFFNPLAQFSRVVTTTFSLPNYEHSPFIFLAWQLIFVLGLCFGEATHSGRFRFEINRRLVIACSLINILLIAWHVAVVQPQLPPLTEYLCGKAHVGIVRLIQIVTLAYLIAVAFYRYPGRFQWLWLTRLGRSSIQVYCVHVILVYSLAPIRSPWRHDWPWALQLLATIAALSVLTVGCLFSKEQENRQPHCTPGDLPPAP